MTMMNKRLKLSEMTQANIVIILGLFSSKITIVNSDPAVVTNLESGDLVLKPGYPGYTPPLFRFAPRRDERSLFYKKTPGVDKFQSPIHELYKRPYNYANLVHSAVAVIQADKVSGVVTFTQVGGPTAPVKVTGTIKGLTPGYHGFHIHQLGDMTNGCKSMKGHFNPLQLKHGAPGDDHRHVGDLGNIVADTNGVATLDMVDSVLSLNGINNIIGRGVVIHAGRDDMGKGGDDGSLKTGNAGARVACAVIGITDSSNV